MRIRFIMLSSVLVLFLVSLFVVSVFPVRTSVGRALSGVSVVGVPEVPLQLPLTGESGTTIYVYGKALIGTKKSSGELNYHVQDVLLTNKLVVDAEGILQSRFTAYPYGKVLTKESFASQKQKFTYTGKEDDKYLMYYGARYMDARTGRFVSIDPALSTPSHYDYANGNPIGNIDPDGRASYRSWSTQIVANIVPALRVAAVGTLAYNLAKGNNLEPQTFISGVIVFHGLMDAAPYLTSHNENKKLRISSSPSEDRMDIASVRKISSQMRIIGGPEYEKLASRFDELGKQGRVFGSGLFLDPDADGNDVFLQSVTGLESDFPATKKLLGYYSPNHDAIVLGLLGGKYHSSFSDMILVLATHEVTHATQGKARMFFSAFLGFGTDSGYVSIFNPVEQPARIAEEDMERKLENQFIDSPMKDEYETYG
ncbi:MAG: RHS repeat-associated core domain-containing protein [Nanoarchaeota archaeon]